MLKLQYFNRRTGAFEGEATIEKSVVEALSYNGLDTGIYKMRGLRQLPNLKGAQVRCHIVVSGEGIEPFLVL